MTQPMAGPCDSPKVVTDSSLPKVLLLKTCPAWRPGQGRQASHIATPAAARQDGEKRCRGNGLRRPRRHCANPRDAGGSDGSGARGGQCGDALAVCDQLAAFDREEDRKSTRLNSNHVKI